MKRALLMMALLAGLCAGLQAQTYTTVTGSNLTDLNGNKLAQGTICFLGTDQADQPVNFALSGGGQVLRRPSCFTITNGAIQGGAQIPNPATTSPSGILYRITVTDTQTKQVVLVYNRVSLQGSSWDFDTYQPLGIPVPPPPNPANVTGPLSVAGDMSVTGTTSLGAVVGNPVFTTPTVAKNFEQIRYADQFTSLQAAVDDLPTSGGEVRMACSATGTNSITTPLVITKNATTLIGCGHDEAGNGTQLTFTPPSTWPAADQWSSNTAYAVGSFVVDDSGNVEVVASGKSGTSGASTPTWPTALGATVSDGTVTWTEVGPPGAIYVVNAYGVRMANFSLSQGNTISGINGLVMVGVHDAHVSNFYIGSTTGSNHNFSDHGLLLADSQAASSIYNAFDNFTVTGGVAPCELLQSNSSAVVNSNGFSRGACILGTSNSLALKGNVSENTFVNLDVSSDAPTQVQVGDATTSQCRDNWFVAITEENSMAPASEVGFDNYCYNTHVETEGMMTGTTPTLIKDENGGTHLYYHASGQPASYRVGSESTIPPLYWSQTLGGVGIGEAAQGSGLAMVSGYGIYAGSTRIAIVKTTGLEDNARCFGLDGSSSGVSYLCGAASAGGLWIFPGSSGGTVAQLGAQTFTGLQTFNAGFTLPSGQAFTSNGTVDLTSGTLKQPASYTANGVTITNPSSAGTLTLTSQLPLSGTLSAWSPGAIAGGACVTTTQPVANATTAMAVAVSPVADPGSGLAWSGWVSAGGTVSVRLCNTTAASITPNAESYNVRVIQ